MPWTIVDELENDFYWNLMIFNQGPAKCRCPIVIGLSVRLVRKKWLSPFYST